MKEGRTLGVLNGFIVFVIVVKVCFVGFALAHFINTHQKQRATTSSELASLEHWDVRFRYWKERTEFVFIVSMALLLMYHFVPQHRRPVNHETGILFFLFGAILLLTADWSLFVREAPWVAVVSSSLR